MPGVIVDLAPSKILCLQPAQPPPAPSKGKIFFRRLSSSIVLWTVVISALFSSNVIADYVFLAIMVVLAGFGLMEFYGLVEKTRFLLLSAAGESCGGALLMVFTFLTFIGPPRHQ